MIHPEKPAPLPVLLGCAFAIRKDYFFDLGGYDEQLMIWNGENYEVISSFKSLKAKLTTSFLAKLQIVALRRTNAGSALLESRSCVSRA